MQRNLIFLEFELKLCGNSFAAPLLSILWNRTLIVFRDPMLPVVASSWLAWSICSRSLFDA
jgi:hypothetical protein